MFGASLLHNFRCARYRDISIVLFAAGDESDEEAEHDEGGQRDDMYDDVYNDGYGEGGGDGGEAAAGGDFGGEDYGSLEYDYYREEGGDGENGGGHEHNGHDASGGGGGDDVVDIYGDVDEGMDVDAGQQSDQQQQQQHQRPASGGLKGGRHPGNLALRGGGGRGGSRGSRSPSRDDDRWGGSQDAPSQLDQPGEQEFYQAGDQHAALSTAHLAGAGTSASAWPALVWETDTSVACLVINIVSVLQ